MLLMLDVGNSNIKFAIFKENTIVNKFKICTNKKQKNYINNIKEAFYKNNINTIDIEGIAISSVVPSIEKYLIDCLKTIFNVKILSLSDNNVKYNLNIINKNKRKLGSDIICDLVSGIKKYSNNFIIVDIGTATTVDVVDKNGVFIGGTIFPGISTISKYLNICSQLENFELQKQEENIGHTTLEAMNGGIFWGYIGMLEKNIEKIKNNFKLSNEKICITGNSFKLIKDDLNFSFDFDENLTIRGLKEIWDLNNK